MWCVVLGATEAPPASPDSLVASPDAQRVAVGGSGSKAVTLTVSGTGRQVAYCTAQDRAGNTAPVVTSGAFGVGVHSDGSSAWLYVGLGAAGLVVAAVVVAGIWRYRRPAPAPAAIPIDAEDAPAMGVADSAAGKPAAAAASATVSIPAISLYASSPHNSLAQAMTLHAEAYVQHCGWCVPMLVRRAHRLGLCRCTTIVSAVESPIARAQTPGLSPQATRASIEGTTAPARAQM